jgi:N-acetylglucosamine-6-phosphate deacetylase
MQRLEANLVGGGFVRVTCARGLIDSVQSIGDSQPGAPFISPGFIDLQINGFAGLDFSDPDFVSGDLDRLLLTLWATGTTTVLPTLISHTPEALKAAFRKLEGFRKTHSRFANTAPAYHLEGPYLSPGPSAGAHKAEYMKNPDWDEFSDIASAAGDHIALVTIAPEWPGAEAFIRRAVKAGVRVALSHTDGSPADVHRAAAAGASLNTHLGNGCPQLLDRHQAPFWAQLDDERLAASIICDGFHLSPEMVRIIARLKGPDRCILVSDAVFVAGLEPGPYQLGGKPIELLSSGQVVTADRRSMAGSTLDMATAVANFRKITQCSLHQAVQAATAIPAAFLGIPGLCHAIKPGQPANLVLFHLRDDRPLVEKTLLAGEPVFDRSSPSTGS